jgi:hypothetical protein
MWNLHITSLAQKAKEALETIETEINDSVGFEDASGGISSLFKETDVTSAAADTNEADYFKVEEEEVSFSQTEPSDKNNNENTNRDESEKDSDVQWDQCEDADSKSDSITSLPEAVAKIEAMEKEMKAIKEELATAKDEIKSYKVINLELEQQVRDLTEENMSLKMNMGAKDTD